MLSFVDFVFENDLNNGRLSLQDAIAIAEKAKDASKEFIEFLKGPVARKFSSDPYVLISTPTQIRKGTYMFTVKGSVKKVAIGMFKNGYVRSVPYQTDSVQSQAQVLANYGYLLSFITPELEIKSSMTKKDFEYLNSINVYDLMSRFVSAKLDESATPEEFPKYKKVIKGKRLKPYIELVNKQGASMGSVSLASPPTILIQPGKGVVTAHLNTIADKQLDGCVFDSETMNQLSLTAIKSSMNDSTFGAKGMNLNFDECSLIGSNIIIPRSTYQIAGSNFINIKNTNASKSMFVIGTSEQSYIECKESNLDGSKFVLGDSLNSVIGLEKCSVKGLEIIGNATQLPNIKQPWDVQQSRLRLDGIKISESSDLSKIVSELINLGENAIQRFRWGNAEWVIKNCDFYGVDLSGITLNNWKDPMKLIDLISSNKNFNLDNNPEVGEKIQRISKTRTLFKR